MAAAVCHRVPVLLLLHPADTIQDAAGHLADAGEVQPAGWGTNTLSVMLGAKLPWEQHADAPQSASDGRDCVSLPHPPGRTLAMGQ